MVHIVKKKKRHCGNRIKMIINFEGHWHGDELWDESRPDCSYWRESSPGSQEAGDGGAGPAGSSADLPRVLVGVRAAPASTWCCWVHTPLRAAQQCRGDRLPPLWPFQLWFFLCVHITLSLWAFHSFLQQGSFYAVILFMRLSHWHEWIKWSIYRFGF